MKKHLLPAAISLALLSGTANAVTIYEKDGFTFKIDGDIQIQLRENAGANKKTGVDFDDSEIKNKVSYDLNNGLTAFAEAHFDTQKSATEETFVGLKTESFKITLGKTNYATDDFATEKSIEGVGNINAFDALAVDGDILRVDFTVGAVNVALSHDLADTDSTDTTDDPESTDLFISAELGAFTLGAAAQNYTPKVGDKSIRSTGASVGIALDKFDIAVDYSKSDENATGDQKELEVLNLSTGFVLSSSLEAAVGFENATNAADTAKDSWYANLVYTFPKTDNVTVFGELQKQEDDSQPGFLVGMRVKF